MSYTVTVRDIQQITDDIKQFRVDRPANYNFVPDQATRVTVDKPDWRDNTRAFSFTSLRANSNLEFIAKIHPGRYEVTNELDKLKVSEQLVIGEPEDAINYTGVGIFLAQGLGVISLTGILRQLREDDELEGVRLILSNETAQDIILEEEIEAMLGHDFLNVLSEQDENDKYLAGPVNRDFLEEHVDDFNKNFYICGPPEFVNNMENILEKLDITPEALAYEE